MSKIIFGDEKATSIEVTSVVVSDTYVGTSAHSTMQIHASPEAIDLVNLGAVLENPANLQKIIHRNETTDAEETFIDFSIVQSFGKKVLNPMSDPNEVTGDLMLEIVLYQLTEAEQNQRKILAALEKLGINLADL